MRGTDEPMHSHMGILCICAGLHRPLVRRHATLLLLSGKLRGCFVVRRVGVYWLGQGRNTYNLGHAIKDAIGAFVTRIEIVHGRACTHNSSCISAARFKPCGIASPLVRD